MIDRTKHAPRSYNDSSAGMPEEAYFQLILFSRAAHDKESPPLLRHALLLGPTGCGKTLTAGLLGHELSNTTHDLISIVETDTTDAKACRDRICATILLNKLSLGRSIAFVDDVNRTSIRFQRALIRVFDERDDVNWIATATGVKTIDPGLAYRFPWIDISPRSEALHELAKAVCNAENIALPDERLADIAKKAGASYEKLYSLLDEAATPKID